MANTSVFVLAPDFPALDGAQMLGGDYASSLHRAAELGYDGVEIIMGDPDAFDPSSFKRLLDGFSLRISAINCGGIQYVFKSALVSADAAQMQFAFDKLNRTMQHCAELGCIQQIGVARGFAVPGRSMRWFKDRLVDVLSAASRRAIELGIEIVFEYTNRFEINSINTAVEAHEIVERVASPALGILIDTYHSYLEDPDVCEAIRYLQKHIRHVHLHDSNGGAAVIGAGENDFERIIRTFGEIGYSRWFSDGLFTEKYSDAELRRSTSTLRDWYSKYDLNVATAQSV
jgi:D-psicose/D-tagatose/L-ribulose 3-epimerase